MKRWLTILAVITFALYHFSNNDADVDLWGNIGFVDSLPWQEGFDWSNTYSYTEPGHKWINHEWLGQYILNRTFHTAGNPGLLALKLMLGFAVLGFIAISMRKDKSWNAAGFLYLVLIISTMGYGYSTRPHHFTYLLYATMLWLIFKSNMRLPLLPLLTLPIAVLWANLHGAFFIGAILLATASISEFLRLLISENKEHAQSNPETEKSQPSQQAHPKTMAKRRNHLAYPAFLSASLIIFVAASFINPYGIRLWSFIFESGSVMRPYLSEWAPLDLIKNFHEHVDFLVLVTITAACLVAARKQTDISEIAVLSLAALAAFFMRRNIPLFAITTGILCFRHVSSVAGESVQNIYRKMHPALISTFLAIFSILSMFYATTFNKTAPLQIEVDRNKFPVSAVEFIKDNEIDGNAIVFFDWAQFAIWHLYPETRVFTDGRFLSAYSSRTVKDYLDFIYARNVWWKDALEEYPTDIVLIHTGNEAFTEMQKLEDWDMVYRDKLAAIFVKQPHKNNFTSELPETGDPRVRIFP